MLNSNFFWIRLLCLVGVSGNKFQVNVNKEWTYEVSVNNKTWLNSADTFLRHFGQTFASGNGTLKLTSHLKSVSGQDTIGKFKTEGVLYEAKGKTLAARVRWYSDENAVVFSQEFLNDLTGTSTGNKDTVLSGFPSFKYGDTQEQLGYIHYCGIFSGWSHLEVTRWHNGSRQGLVGGMTSGPIVLFDLQDNVIVISPLSHFMASSFSPDGHSVSWGIMGGVDQVPKGHQQEFVLFYSDEGINQGMRRWGSMMQRYYNRKPSLREHDLSNLYLGYTTGHGAYYYHVAEPSMNYEETFLQLQKSFKDQNIPIGYFQYDDWFYPIAGSGYGATVTWDGLPDIFPHGMTYLYNKTQLPVFAHNRYWSNLTTYAKENGGKFNFIIDGENSIPNDQSFWDYLLSTSKEWGLYVYEQDFLYFQTMNIKPVYSDLTFGRQWLMQMGKSAEKNGLPIQYCMGLPRNILASLEIPAVTQARVSADYVPERANQYQIGVTNLFVDSIGLAPYKDTFWSLPVQPGNQYNRTETNPPFEAAISLLGSGPVGFGDRLGHNNPVLLRSLVTSEGKLLKPSRAITAIDANIKEMAFRGELEPRGNVWSTFSEISGFVFGVVLATDLRETYQLRLSDAGFTTTGPQMLFDSPHTPAQEVPRPFSDSKPLQLRKCFRHILCLHFTSPIFSVGSKRLFLLGETDKMLPLSITRMASISYRTDDLEITLKGSPGEEVKFSACNADDTRDCLLIPCVIGEEGYAYLSLAKATCIKQR